MCLTPQLIRTLIIYDYRTGEARWLRRPLREGHEHHDKIWNSRWAGKPVGWRNKHGYLQTSINNRKYLVHRLVWFYHYGRWPRRDIDHRNGKTGDNAIANLREASMSQNIMNSKRRTDNSSGYKGVSIDKRDGRWQAYINVNGKRISLGRFATATEAYAAYLRAAKIHHKHFSRELSQ